MVIFVKPNGTTVVENDVIGLGSFVGKIAVVSPTRTGAYVTLHIAPANGEYLKPMYCAPMISTDVDDLGIYLCDMTRSISAVSGRVRYQVSFVYEDGREEFTPEGSFTVSQGVVSIPPDDPSESMYNAIRSALIANINNYTEIVEKLDMVWEAKTLVEENLEKINASRDAAAASAAEAEEIKDQTRDVVEQSLSEAKESGMFDGVSVTHEWDGSVLRVTSASGTSESDLRGPEGKRGETGKGFEISKTYSSVAAMNAGFYSDGVPLYGFVLIDTGNVEDEDNAKLYVKQESVYEYLIDLSGSEGIKGERGYSAYDIAVQQGFVGGETEWLASLKKPAEDAAKNVVAIANDASENALKQAKESGEFDGKSSYQYAQDGGYTGTEEEFAEDINPNNIKADANNFIATELAKRGQLKPEFANSVEECTDTSKLYVLPDGFIYGYIFTETAVGGYTNLAEPLPNNTTDTSKWVNGYRFSSSGISEQSRKTVSNYIQCTKGNKVRIKGITFEDSVDRIWVGKADKNQIELKYATANATSYVGKATLNGDVYEIDILNDNVGFIRFAMTTPTDASLVIVTVDQEIKEATVVKEYAWANTGHSIVPNDYDEEFAAFYKDINQIKVDVTSLEAADKILQKNIAGLDSKIDRIGETEIPDYWQTHLDGKIETIKNLHKQYGKDCFSFVLMTDTHYPSNLGKCSPLLAKKIMDDANIKYALHVGDWQTRGCHKTKEALLAENVEIETMFAPIRERLLMQQGNHDGAYGSLDRDGGGLNNTGKEPAEMETYVHNLTPQELHEFCYRKVGMVGNVHFDDTGTAYYIDDTSNNVRYIGLNTQRNDYELQADGTQKYPKMWIMRFTQPQFDFLTNEALVENVTNKTKIVIFGHVPTTQELGDGGVMNGLLCAFRNRTTYTGSYAGEYGYDAVSVNVDFTNAKGRLVGYFHGHTHVDSVFTINSSFNVIGTRCDAKEENTDALKNERIAGTITEQSFDVFTVTGDKIYATKIGAGADREIIY